MILPRNKRNKALQIYLTIHDRSFVTPRLAPELKIGQGGFRRLWAHPLRSVYSGLIIIDSAAAFQTRLEIVLEVSTQNTTVTSLVFVSSRFTAVIYGAHKPGHSLYIVYALPYIV